MYYTTWGGGGQKGMAQIFTFTHGVVEYHASENATPGKYILGYLLKYRCLSTGYLHQDHLIQLTLFLGPPLASRSRSPFAL